MRVIDTRRYSGKATLFADGDKGMRLQERAVYDGETDTGIRYADRKANHRANWVRIVTYAGKEYPSVHEAIEAYESVGEYPPGYSPPKGVGA